MPLWRPFSAGSNADDHILCHAAQPANAAAERRSGEHASILRAPFAAERQRVERRRRGAAFGFEKWFRTSRGG